MFHMVLATFVGTRLANVSADAAYSLGLGTATRHIRSGQSANLCAIHVEGNAARHRLHVIFFEAGGRAKVTGIRAGVASVNAVLKVHLVHDVLLVKKSRMAAAVNERRTSVHFGQLASRPMIASKGQEGDARKLLTQFIAYTVYTIFPRL